MFDIVNFPDLRAIPIMDLTLATVSAGSAETLFDAIMPPDRVGWIFRIRADPSAGVGIEGGDIEVDDIPLGTTTFGGAIDTPAYVNDSLAWTNTTSNIKEFSAVPIRRKIRVHMQTGGVDGTVRVRVWAMMHQDTDKEFQTVCPVQGQ